jgi:nucleoside-diphosphate-sugar epimerase
MSDFLSFMDIAIQSSAPNGVYNVSSGEAHSIKEIFDLVTVYLGLPKQEVPIVAVEADDVPVVALDPSETLKAFAWKSKISFADTINKQLAWYDQFGISDVFSHLKSSELPK